MSNKQTNNQTDKQTNKQAAKENKEIFNWLTINPFG